MRATGILVGIVSSLWAITAVAQPSETPPPGVGGTYIDRAGCAWQRVDIGGQVAWAALNGADGAQLCNMAPSVPETTSATDGAETAAPPTQQSETTPGAGQASAEEPTAQTAPAMAAKKAATRAPKRPKFPTNGYYLQVGAFEKPGNADRAVRFLQGQSFGALQAQYRGRTPMQIVYAGPFESRAAADMARRAARDMGYRDAFVWEPH